MLTNNGVKISGQPFVGTHERPTDKNRFVAEKLGVAPTYDEAQSCPHCGIYCRGKSIFCNPPIPLYPDFSTDAGAVQLLRLMMEREDFDDFVLSLGEFPSEFKHNNGLQGIMIVLSYLTAPDKLLDAVAERFGWKE